MVNFIKVISTEVNKATNRVVKYLRNGKYDVQTSEQIAPYGIDSNPIKDMIAIYASSAIKGDSVILGYINKNQLAEVGENRIFSTNESGDLSTFLWLKNDGTMEVGGGTDFMVRFSEMETAFNELKGDFNNHVHDGVVVSVSGGSGAPAVGTPGDSAPPTSTSSADISGAKIAEIKTI